MSLRIIADSSILLIDPSSFFFGIDHIEREHITTLTYTSKEKGLNCVLYDKHILIHQYHGQTTLYKHLHIILLVQGNLAKMVNHSSSYN